MLRFFRINDPYRLVFVFLILVGVRVVQAQFIEGVSVLELKWLLLGQWLGEGFLMYREAYDYTGPLAAMIYKYIDQIFGRSLFVHHALSSMLLIIQAGIFNGILIRNKAFDENSYLPAFLYVIVSLAIPDFMALSPPLMSMTFVLMTLGNVLRRIDNQATDELFLNSGLFVGVATMIYLPAFIFLLVFLFALIVFSSAIVRRLILYLFGFILVVSLCSIYFYWRGDLTYFIDFFFKGGLMLEANEILSVKEILLLSIPFALVLLLAVSRSITTARLTNFQQRVQQINWFIFLGGIGCFFLTNRKSGIELIFLVPLITYFLNQYFMLLRNRLFRFIMPGLIVFGLLAINLYLYSNYSEKVTVQEQIVDYEKVLVIGENLSFYVSKDSGSPCFSKPICETAFEGLAYYKSSTDIFRWMEKVDADLIVDELNIIPEVFHRFPPLAEKYSHLTGSNYIKINN